MKQFLRSFLTLLMLVVWASGFAQEVTLDFTKANADWGIPTDPYVTKAATYTNGTYTISFGASSTKGHKAIEGGVIMGKKDAFLTLPAFDFDVEKIIVRGKSGASQVVTENIFVGSKAVSSPQTNAQKDLTFNINDAYQAKGNVYILKVTNRNNTQFSKIEIYKKASSKTPTTLTFPEQAISINGGDEANFKGQPAKLCAGKQELTDKTIKYAHTGDDIFATFDETTGAATLKSGVYGTATVTATYVGDDTYEEAKASYNVKIVDPNALEVTFDFSKPEVYHYDVPSQGKATNLEEGDKMQSGIITITNIQSGKSGANTNKARFHNKSGNITFHVYANGTISLSAQTGYTITKFAFKAAQGGDLTVSTGTYDSATKTWEGNAQSITLTIPNGEDATWFQTMTVTYSKVAAATPLTLDETTTAEDAKTLLEANRNKTVNVTINRTLVANKWNTLCLPFDVTAEQIKNILKAEGMVREYKDQTADCINFQAAETMTAGVPYLIKPTEEVKGLTFEGVKITATEGVAKGAEAGSTDENLSICGVLGAKALSTDGSELFLNAAGKFVAPAEGKQTMRGFRAYFMSMLGASAKINIDGETTGINSIETEATVNGKVYNLNGQYVGNSLNGLKKGIYVVNGKKVIK